MVFVAYSHRDRKWLDDFEEMAAPLKKYGGLRPHSDKDIKPGEEWRRRIDEMLRSATVAVLLVSRHFLNSDFIMNIELPAILKAQKERGLEVIWLLVSHCLWEESPLESLQAALSTSVPLKDLNETQCDAEFKKLCKAVKEALERPALDPAMKGKAVTRKAENLRVLLRPCARRVEVFARQDNSADWYHQGGIDAGNQNLTCYFGTEKTAPNTGFHIIGMTTDARVPHQGGKPTKPLPSYRQVSDQMRVIRK
jgi:hypothetical protein